MDQEGRAQEQNNHGGGRGQGRARRRRANHGGRGNQHIPNPQVHPQQPKIPGAGNPAPPLPNLLDVNLNPNPGRAHPQQLQQNIGGGNAFQRRERRGGWRHYDEPHQGQRQGHRGGPMPGHFQGQFGHRGGERGRDFARGMGHHRNENYHRNEQNRYGAQSEISGNVGSDCGRSG